MKKNLDKNIKIYYQVGKKYEDNNVDLQGYDNYKNALYVAKTNNDDDYLISLCIEVDDESEEGLYYFACTEFADYSESEIIIKALELTTLID